MPSSPRRSGLRRPLAGLAAASCVAVTAALLPSTAAEAALAPDTPLSGASSTMYQTNARVETLDVSGGVLYAGGRFTQVRAPGTTSGGTARSYLAAFSTSTGSPTSFAPTLNGNVYSVDVSPDGSTVYVGGAFTTVNGSTRNHFAAFSTSTGALTSWNPNAGSGTGYSVLATASAVYIGGTFTKVANAARLRLASTNPTTGALNTAFTATADNQVTTMLLTNDGSNRLIVGGNFNTIAGGTHHALVSLDPTTGAVQNWVGNGALPNEANPDPNNPFGGCTALAADLVQSNGVVYVGSDGVQPGCFDGDEAITTGGSATASGTIQWINPCEGATVALAVLNNTLYKGSHMHDCGHSSGGPGGGFVGGFDRNDRQGYHLIGQSLTDGSFVHWQPNTDVGTPTYKGPAAMATDGSQLFVGGDFTKVNGTTQVGLARFRPISTGSATPQRPLNAPVAIVTGNKAVNVSVPYTYDPDNGTLTYQLYRGTTLVGTASQETWPWSGPTLRFNVTVPNATTAYTFKYRVTDGTNTTGYSSSSNSVTASTANAPGSYVSTVTGASPSVWWRLDGNGSDSSGHGVAAAYDGGTSNSSTGAIPGDGSVSLDGSTGYVGSTTSSTLPGSFTESVWFKTSTLYGGALLGRSQTQTGADPLADRVMWLDDSGVVAFAMKTQLDPNAPPGPPNATLRSGQNSYNDGKWHQAVATYDGTNMSLYVDGALESTTTATAATDGASYFYRAGYVDLSGLSAVFGTNTTEATAPNSYFLNGSVDEVSFYGSALSAAQVTAQFASDAANLN